ncbi:MAG: hypothetical protein UH854_06620 [Clostridia bacterium]|nr:hypothetical protein [Clostridia bacterium]
MYKKCIYNNKAVAYVEEPWVFKTDADKEKKFEITFDSAETFTEGSIEAVVEKYNCAETDYALKIYATMGNIKFMVDKIKAKQPINVYSYFCFENESRGVSINIPDKSKLVVRNGANGFKFFRMKNEVDGNDMIPFGCLQLPEGVASNGIDLKMNFYDGMHKEGLLHTKVFCICTGDSATIPGWHMRNMEDGGFLAEPRDKANNYVLYTEGDTVTIKGLASGEVLEIDLKKFM